MAYFCADVLLRNYSLTIRVKLKPVNLSQLALVA